MKRQAHNTPRGFSLLELLVATAIMAIMATTVAVLLRTSQNAWEGTDSDHSRLEAAHAVARHLVRQLRQAEEVTAISGPSDVSGTISARMSTGDTYVWDHAADTVNFGVGTADSLLADGISELSFIGYKADGTTTTTVAAEVQSVECKLKVQLPRDTGGDRIIRGRAWIRSW